MADREYIRSPQIADCMPIKSPVFRFYQQISQKINKLMTSFYSIPTYADNAAAIAGGLSVGDYYHTATGEVRIVV